MRRKAQKFLLIFLVLCLSFFLRARPQALPPEEKARVEHVLSLLSKREKADLKALFDYHFFLEGFAYTLFGSKPMSIGFLLPTDKAANGWKAWEKISHTISPKQFIIQKYIYREKEFICIANLKEVSNTYHKNKNLFSDFMSPEALCSSLPEHMPQLMQDAQLLGTLLGYGTNNAREFAQRKQLRPFSNVLHPIFYYPSGILPPGFACDPTTEETKALKKRYTKERKKIIAMSKRTPLFLHMLALLTRP